MSAAQKLLTVIVVLGLLAVAVVLIAYWYDRRVKAKERADEEADLADYWDGERAAWDPITRTYSHGYDLSAGAERADWIRTAERVHAIDLTAGTVRPVSPVSSAWPQRVTTLEHDWIRDTPLRIPTGWVRPKPAHHAAVDDGTWGMAELGEGVAAVDPEPTLGRHSHDAARLRQITGSATQAPRWAGEATGAYVVVEMAGAR